MEFARIVGTELSVSRIALGTWSIGGWMWGGADDDQAVRTIRSAIDRGITLIDTAPIYGFGHAEKLVGRALKESGARDRVVLATKVGLNWHDNKPFRDARPERIETEVEESMRRLSTDRIDIYQVHWPDPETPIKATAEAMQKLFEQRKIKAIGVSNFSRNQMHDFRKVARVHTAQPPFNLFEREAEDIVLPYCHWHSIAVLAYGAICRGLLSGRMRSDTQFTGDDLRRIDPKFSQPRFGQYLRAVEDLDNFARENYGKRVIHLALRWVLDQPGVTTALWGARRPSQLDPLEEVMGWRLDADAMGEIDRILRRNIKDPIGPQFMAPPSRPEAVAA
jgi:aryl-alcohol dehydrogenase-like predicted oxidoreductase